VRIKGGSATPKNPSFDQVIDEKVVGVGFYGFECHYRVHAFFGGRSQLGCCVAKSGKIHTTSNQTHKKMTPPISKGMVSF